MRDKLMSGRYLWCVVSAAIFAYLAVTLRIDPKDSLTVIAVVLSFYFGQAQAQPPQK